MKIRKVAQIAAALAAAGTVASAHAALVGSWDYSVETQFAGVNTFTNGGASGTQSQTPRQVTWGDGPFSDVFKPGSGRSGITMSDDAGKIAGDDITVNPQTGVVVTDDLSLAGIGKGVWITHHNNPISADTLLTSQVTSKLQLWANPPRDIINDPADVTLPTIDFTIYFAETPNAEPCVVTGPGVSVCNDIFALKASQALNQSFIFGGDQYFVSIFPITGPGLGSFTALTLAECNAAGAGAGCVGFTTNESQDTTIQFGFAITGKQVDLPEPEMLGLFGLSLLGLVAARRRRVS